MYQAYLVFKRKPERAKEIILTGKFIGIVKLTVLQFRFALFLRAYQYSRNIIENTWNIDFPCGYMNMGLKLGYPLRFSVVVNYKLYV